MQPHDTTNEIPVGYCQCGCGQQTTIAKENNAAKGYIKGQPFRFIQGHNAWKPVPLAAPQLCECGCGQFAALATISDPKRGYVRGQPMRFIIGHHNRLAPSRPVEERFWEKVKKAGPDDCWLWTATKNSNGYGQFVVGSKKDKSQRRVPAHRFSYELRYGPLPKGVEVCHNCPGKDNPTCVNPAHLFPGTHLDNMRDMVKKGRNTPGIRNARAKLTDDAVRKIRQLCTDGVLHETIARQFGVSDSLVSAIKRRTRWNHVE